MSDHHPNWLLGLVAAVEQYEDFHTAPVESWQCFGNALGAVPRDVRQQARGYGQALRETKHWPVPAAVDSLPAAAPDITGGGEVAGPSLAGPGPATAREFDLSPTPEHIADVAAKRNAPLTDEQIDDAVVALAGALDANPEVLAVESDAAVLDQLGVAATDPGELEPGTVTTWLFSFGSGQEYDGTYVLIDGTYDGARDEMMAHFGNRWSFQYHVDSYGASQVKAEYRELPRDEWPPRNDVAAGAGDTPDGGETR